MQKTRELTTKQWIFRTGLTPESVSKLTGISTSELAMQRFNKTSPFPFVASKLTVKYDYVAVMEYVKKEMK
jgi:hypothetical protein